MVVFIFFKIANYVGNLLTFDFLRTTSKVQKVAALHILLVKQVWLYDAAKKRCYQAKKVSWPLGYFIFLLANDPLSLILEVQWSLAFHKVICQPES